MISILPLLKLLLCICLVTIWLNSLGGSCLAFDNLHLIEDAEAGDQEAQYTLAQLYSKGQGGVERSIAVAIMWFRRAAEAGHEDSMYSLAMVLLENKKDNEQLAESFGWLQKAADAGHADSQYALGRAYGAGDRDPEKSVYWLKQAVTSGHPEASVYLDTLCKDKVPGCD